MNKKLLLILIPVLLLVSVYATYWEDDYVISEPVIDYQQKYIDLQQSYQTLLLERKVVGRELFNLQTRYDELENIFDGWLQHSELKPQTRNEYSLFPIGLSDEVRISFPHAYRCMQGWNVYGKSMQPFFGDGHTVVGDTCFLESDIKVGDIIVFNSEDIPLTVHQIIDKTSEGYVTKGIYNFYNDDGFVEFSDVVAVVVIIIY